MGDRVERWSTSATRTFGEDSNPRPWGVASVACRTCGHEGTTCVWSRVEGGSSGYSVEEEHHCPVCGWYTVHELDWDS